MHLPFLLLVRDQHGVGDINAVGCKVRRQNLPDKRLFGRPFREQVQARHQYGPPPTMFFSQTSPSE